MAQIYTLLQIRHKLVLIQTLKRFLIARFFPCLILEHMLSFVGMCWMTVQPWFDLAQLIKAHDWVHNCFCNVWVNINKLKFRFSKKATKFETISHMIWVYLVNVKSIGRLFWICMAFSERPNFTFNKPAICPSNYARLIIRMYFKYGIRGRSQTTFTRGGG